MWLNLLTQFSNDRIAEILTDFVSVKIMLLAENKKALTIGARLALNYHCCTLFRYLLLILRGIFTSFALSDAIPIVL
jgi:hypothetical protein